VDELEVRELHRDFDRQLLVRLYREVLEPAFAPEELEGIESLASRLTRPGEPGSLVAVALGPDGDVVGGLVADHDRDCRVLLLSYLAVRPDLRGQGIGSRLMRDVVPAWYEARQVLLTLAEVHDPRHWSDRGDMAVARLRLSERLGARALATRFVQPSLHGDRERVRGFLLLALHVDPSIRLRDGDKEGIPASLLARFVRRYYDDAEGPVSSPDPELASLLARIEQDDLMQLVPLSEYERVV
jgi:GNAT superfamily N-acetyltransferase